MRSTIQRRGRNEVIKKGDDVASDGCGLERYLNLSRLWF